jgi:hypothetical protein
MPKRDDGGKASAKAMMAAKHPPEKQRAVAKHQLEIIP